MYMHVYTCIYTALKHAGQTFIRCLLRRRRIIVSVQDTGCIGHTDYFVNTMYISFSDHSVLTSEFLGANDVFNELLSGLSGILTATELHCLFPWTSTTTMNLQPHTRTRERNLTHVCNRSSLQQGTQSTRQKTSHTYRGLTTSNTNRYIRSKWQWSGNDVRVEEYVCIKTALQYKSE